MKVVVVIYIYYRRGDHGVFTTMWIFDKSFKILFFKDHINNLIKSAKAYEINTKNLKKNIFKLLRKNLSNSKKYNHLLRIALNKKVISISLRNKIKIKNNLVLKLVELKRQKPEYKNLKYGEILSHNLFRVGKQRTIFKIPGLRK